MGSPYRDLERPPLQATRLTRALLQPGGLWTAIEVVASTGSTNADVIDASRSGAPEGLVIIAEHQTTGRGRLDRVWTSPARAGIAMSMLLRPAAGGRGYPSVPVAQFGWLPLLVGVALVETVSRLALLQAALKWPNDLLLGERKAGGILAEAVPTEGGATAVVVGIGLNVTLRANELPIAHATSLAIEGAAATDRDPLVRETLRATQRWYDRWLAAAGDAEKAGLAPAYRDHCVTIGHQVTVHLPGDRRLSGMASDVDASGRLVVITEKGVELVSAGDVVHVRRGQSSDG